MKNKRLVLTLGTTLLSLSVIVGCGNTSSNNTDNQSIGSSQEVNNDSNELTRSYIPYLRNNHANYKEHGSNQIPVPVKEATTRSINWTIAATTEYGAVKLADHIRFMERELQMGKNPRAWDKLFLMEAYMKYNKYYTTNVERSGTNVVVSKVANTRCAYEVISAHSDAVSGDFFARGDVMQDYSSKADAILKSPACNDVKDSLKSYISSRQRNRGMM